MLAKILATNCMQVAMLHANDLKRQVPKLAKWGLPLVIGGEPPCKLSHAYQLAQSLLRIAFPDWVVPEMSIFKRKNAHSLFLCDDFFAGGWFIYPALTKNFKSGLGLP